MSISVFRDLSPLIKYLKKQTIGTNDNEYVMCKNEWGEKAEAHFIILKIIVAVSDLLYIKFYVLHI